MNIYQRINEVRKKVSYLRKDKKVGEGGYMAITHDAVTAEVRDHLVEHGIVIVPQIVSSSTVATGTTTSKGTPFIRYEARYKFFVVNVESPEDHFTVEIEAHAIDQGDKAPGKALSYAKKYAMIKLLEIESGDDEEGRQEQHRPKEEKKTASPTDGAVSALTPDMQVRAKTVAASVVDLWADEKPLAAYEQVYQGGHTGEMILAVWELLKPHSEIRRELKKMHAEDSKPAKGAE